MRTLLLDRQKWDLVANAAGNIALAGDPYSQAQDAASAIKLFDGELYYDTTKGVPYWSQILGLAPPISYMKSKFVAAALTVPGVVTAKAILSAITLRVVSGQVQITNGKGQTSAASF